MAGFRATSKRDMRSDSRALRSRPEELVGTKISLRLTPAYRGDLARRGVILQALLFQSLRMSSRMLGAPSPPGASPERDGSANDRRGRGPEAPPHHTGLDRHRIRPGRCNCHLVSSDGSLPATSGARAKVRADSRLMWLPTSYVPV